MNDRCISCADKPKEVGDLCFVCFEACVPKLAANYIERLHLRTAVEEWKQEAEERDQSYAYWMKQANQQYTRAEDLAAKLAVAEQRATVWKKAARAFRAMREHCLARTEAYCLDYLNKLNAATAHAEKAEQKMEAYKNEASDMHKRLNSASALNSRVSLERQELQARVKVLEDALRRVAESVWTHPELRALAEEALNS